MIEEDGWFRAPAKLAVLQESCHQCGSTLGHRMPVQHILDKPECARKLLETTGIKNTRIVTELPVNASRWNRTWRPAQLADHASSPPV